jgi:hypothetical protein
MASQRFLVADAVAIEVESINTRLRARLRRRKRIYTDQSGRPENRIRNAAAFACFGVPRERRESCSTASYDSLVARAIGLAMLPVTRQAPVKRLRLAQQAWSRSLASKVISSERAVPF